MGGTFGSAGSYKPGDRVQWEDPHEILPATGVVLPNQVRGSCFVFVQPDAGGPPTHIDELHLEPSPTEAHP